MQASGKWRRAPCPTWRTRAVHNSGPRPPRMSTDHITGLTQFSLELCQQNSHHHPSQVFKPRVRAQSWESEIPWSNSSICASWWSNTSSPISVSTSDKWNSEISLPKRWRLNKNQALCRKHFKMLTQKLQDGWTSILVHVSQSQFLVAKSLYSQGLICKNSWFSQSKET